VTPFILGSSLALLLYPHLSNSSVSFTSFSLFLGVSMSVTAFPVLARILTDRRIQKTKMGVLTLTCAAIDDVSAWCLLAFVVSVTQAHSGSALKTVLMASAYIALMLLVVRPIVSRLIGWIDDKGRLTQGVLAFVLLGILFSSLTTESIGIHSIFGAFVLGAIIPSRSAVAREVTSKLEDFVIVFLLPAFFAFTGLRTQIGLVNGVQNWLFCFLIVLVASLGKFGGSFLAARFSGLTVRDSSALGVLMNTRGLMELIVLNIGLELHVISPALFAMLVLMALATTLATTPILHFITPRGKLESEAAAIDHAHEIALAAGERTGVLIPVSNGTDSVELLDLAMPLTGSNAPPPRVLAMNRGSLTGASARVREEEAFSLSRSPVLAAALDAAWSRKMSITPEAVWTTDAAAAIVEAAQRTQVRWVLLGSRRSLFGGSPKNSVVNRVMENIAMQPVNVGVLLQRSSFKQGSLSCVVHGAEHGTGAIELAVRLLQSPEERLNILMVAPESNVEPQWIKRAANGANVQVEAIVLAHYENISAHMPTGRIIMAKDVVDRWHIDLDHRDVERSVILVKGACVPNAAGAVNLNAAVAVAAG
jgi:Kef-type K+ transport system membrane component KefB